MTNKNIEFSSIHEEINKAISTVNELEKWIKQLSNEKQIIQIEEQSPLQDKLHQLHKEVECLTQTLIELGILDLEDILH